MNQLDVVRIVEGIENYDDFHSNYNFLEEKFKAEFCSKLTIVISSSYETF